MASSLFADRPNQQRINPLQNIFQAVQSGQNPRDFVRAMAQNDPTWAKVEQAIGSLSPQQVGRQLDQNAHTQGSSLQQLMNLAANQLGLPFGGNGGAQRR